MPGTLLGALWTVTHLIPMHCDVGTILSLSPLYRWGNWDIGRKVTCSSHTTKCSQYWHLGSMAPKFKLVNTKLCHSQLWCCGCGVGGLSTGSHCWPVGLSISLHSCSLHQCLLPTPQSPFLFGRRQQELDLLDREKTGLMDETGAALMPAQHGFTG